MEGYHRGSGRGENGGKGTGNKKYKWLVQNRQGEVKNHMGNGEAKEVICVTSGNYGGREQYRAEGIKREKKMGQL